MRARDSEVPPNTGNWSTVTTARPQLAVSYVYEANPPGQPGTDIRGDTGLAELTDGQLPPDGATWAYQQNAGFNGIEPRIRFDLGGLYKVAAIDVTAYWWPTNAVVSVSSDNITYSAATNYPLSATGYTTATLDVSALGDARYYRITFKGSGSWMFFSEVDFYPPAPTPPSGTLISFR